ncbi:hypothetical protein [Pseudomonas sp. MWU12-2037]|uniref:hypothetical protein n=1 Tax=Pseudomonas sp. MWU12-2037 TaxID=2928690 RepID=UPI00200F82B9|nr:hypothetical protein [Pseudomonas sp. MWU12-2037]
MIGEITKETKYDTLVPEYQVVEVFEAIFTGECSETNFLYIFIQLQKFIGAGPHGVEEVGLRSEHHECHEYEDHHIALCRGFIKHQALRLQPPSQGCPAEADTRGVDHVQPEYLVR